MKTKEKLIKVYVEYYKNYESGGEICEGQENDPWPSYDDTIYDSGVCRVSLKLPTNVRNQYEQFKINWDHKKGIYVVYVEYRDGDTFGASFGNIQIEGVYETSKEAEKICESINKDKYKPRDLPNSTTCQYWTCYFNAVQDCQVRKFEVEE